MHSNIYSFSSKVLKISVSKFILFDPQKLFLDKYNLPTLTGLNGDGDSNDSRATIRFVKIG